MVKMPKSWRDEMKDGNTKDHDDLLIHLANEKTQKAIWDNFLVQEYQKNKYSNWPDKNEIVKIKIKNNPKDIEYIVKSGSYYIGFMDLHKEIILITKEYDNEEDEYYEDGSPFHIFYEIKTNIYKIGPLLRQLNMYYDCLIEKHISRIENGVGCMFVLICPEIEKEIKNLIENNGWKVIFIKDIKEDKK